MRTGCDSGNGRAAPSARFRPTHEQDRRATTRKRRAIFAAGLCGVAVVAIVVLAVVLSENVVYFRTVSEAVHARKGDGTGQFRIAGAVVPGTVHETEQRRALRGHRRQEDRPGRPGR